MHCPRCGQEQISADTRFCSRCGFSLALVAEVLANGGTLPQLVELNEKKNKKFLTRQTGLKIGLAWFLVVTFLLTPLAAIANLEEGVAAIAIIGFIGGLLIMLFSRLFLENEKSYPKFETSPNYLGTNVNQSVLPPQQSPPIQDFTPPAGYWKTPNTEEFAQPSVTEETTKFLRRDK